MAERIKNALAREIGEQFMVGPLRGGVCIRSKRGSSRQVVWFGPVTRPWRQRLKAIPSSLKDGID